MSTVTKICTIKKLTQVKVNKLHKNTREVKHAQLNSDLPNGPYYL